MNCAQVLDLVGGADPPTQGTSEPLPPSSPSALSDLPLIDYNMFVPMKYNFWTESLTLASRFTTSDFDDILASFSRGEWTIPTGADDAARMDNDIQTYSIG